MVAWLGNFGWVLALGVVLGVVLLAVVIYGLLWHESAKAKRKWAEQSKAQEEEIRKAINTTVLQRVRENEQQIDFIKGNVEYLQTQNAGQGRVLGKLEEQVDTLVRRLP